MKQLCATFHELARTADAKKTTYTVVLDFKKAFNQVPQALLMQKLKLIPDMRPQPVNWVQDFLKNRRQRVVIVKICYDFVVCANKQIHTKSELCSPISVKLRQLDLHSTWVLTGNECCRVIQLCLYYVETLKL